MPYLPREVKDEVLVLEWCQTLPQPVQVLFQVFHAVDEAAIGTQHQVSHHITHCDQVGDVHVTPENRFKILVWVLLSGALCPVFPITSHMYTHTQNKKTKNKPKPRNLYAMLTVKSL